jgi:hypothetical protein
LCIFHDFDSFFCTADVQHMFHCFIVREDHRNYLRFLWYKDNDFEKELIEYRESNTPLICSGFLGWYTPNNGKYQRSSFSCNGGATSAWLLSSIG